MKRLLSLFLILSLGILCLGCGEEEEKPSDEIPPEEQVGYLFGLPGDETVLEMRSLGDGFVLLSRYEDKWIVSYTDISKKILTETLLSLPVSGNETPVFLTFSDDEEFGFIYLDHRLFFVSPQTGQYAEYTLPKGIDLSGALFGGGEFYYPAKDGILCSDFEFSYFSVLNTAPLTDFAGLAALEEKSQVVYYATQKDGVYTGISCFERGKEGVRTLSVPAFDTFLPLKDGNVLLQKNSEDGITLMRYHCPTQAYSTLHMPLTRNLRTFSVNASGELFGGICYKNSTKDRTAIDLYDMKSASLIQRYDLVYAALYDKLALSENGRYLLYCRKTRDGRIVCYLDTTETT